MPNSQNTARDDFRNAYIQKLKDPRWQKKRLEILNRDQWTCQTCFSKDKTLHVHHRYYMPKSEPWEYPDTALVTLCEECHEYETEERKCAEHDILLAFKRAGFFTSDINTMVMAFASLEGQSIELLPDTISWLISDPVRREKLIEECIKSR